MSTIKGQTNFIISLPNLRHKRRYKMPGLNATNRKTAIAAIAHPLCKHIYLTRIYRDYDSDVFFPSFEDTFTESSDPDVDGKMREDNGIQFRFEVYDRK
ncbi:dihydrofolate reductase-like [Haliotis rubra]|uniref:dihydrofolate reductase-like n=1 Tax=Haliotis rubra TaxID=36100 RepID=UPI001EE569FF|nr:dihydrofolate reductase-like [Haliotis rubra]